jgi:hypothetical protein
MGIRHSKHHLTKLIQDEKWKEVETLLTENVDRDYRDIHGRSSLLHAIEKNAPIHIMPYVISVHNINGEDHDKVTPLLAAVKNERWDIVALLCKHNAIVDHKVRFPSRSDTVLALHNPLAYALERNVPLDILTLLISKANVNVETADHQVDQWLCRLETPLHIALRKKDICAARVLLDNGADCTMCNHKGNMPCMIYLNLPAWKCTTNVNSGEAIALMDRLVPSDSLLMYTTVINIITGPHFRNQYKEMQPYFMCLLHRLKRMDITSVDVTPENRITLYNGLFHYLEPFGGEENLGIFRISFNGCEHDWMIKQNVELVMAFFLMVGFTSEEIAQPTADELVKRFAFRRTIVYGRNGYPVSEALLAREGRDAAAFGEMLSKNNVWFQVIQNMYAQIAQFSQTLSTLEKLCIWKVREHMSSRRQEDFDGLPVAPGIRALLTLEYVAKALYQIAAAQPPMDSQSTYDPPDDYLVNSQTH